jgi:hypothetical protein
LRYPCITWWSQLQRGTLVLHSLTHLSEEDVDPSRGLRGVGRHIVARLC